MLTVSELLAQHAASSTDRQKLERAVLDIVAGYARGTRYGIAADADGLLRAGVPGTQLTWMDAKVGDWVVTPRRGKPVARLVPIEPGKRVLTLEQQAARQRARQRMREGWDLGGYKFNRDELYER